MYFVSIAQTSDCENFYEKRLLVKMTSNLFFAYFCGVFYFVLVGFV